METPKREDIPVVESRRKTRGQVLLSLPRYEVGRSAPSRESLAKRTSAGWDGGDYSTVGCSAEIVRGRDFGPGAAENPMRRTSRLGCQGRNSDAASDWPIRDRR